MRTAQILKSCRRDHNLSDDDIAQVFGLTRQRWNHYANGQPIPQERLIEWAARTDLPDWARHLIDRLWLAALEEQHANIGRQLQQLGTLIAERNNGMEAAP
jgi:transcriptional regulator with XRE-family HTH domain